MITITIGIPVFGQSEYLSTAIESALDQSVNCEVIVCADGDQEAYEIAKKYPIRVINQTNRGLASARNCLIMNMHGDFFLPLDSDDMLLDNAVERIEQVIKENPDADIVAPSLKTFGTSNEQVILMPSPKLEDFRTGNRIGYLAAIRKSKLLEIGGYSPRMQEGYEDLHLTMNLLSRGAKIVTIPEVLWLYRTKSESMWTKTLEHHQKLIDQINKDVPEAQLNFRHNAESR